MTTPLLVGFAVALCLFLAAVVALGIVARRLGQAKDGRDALAAEGATLRARVETLTGGEAHLRASLRDAEADTARLLEDLKRYAGIEARYRDILDVDAELDRRRADVVGLDERARELHREVDVLDEEANLQSFGFYKPHYDFESSERYRAALESVRERQKLLIKSKAAAVCSVEWTVSGSRSEGRKATNQTLKLMLRAFNGESDAAIAKVRYNNVLVMESRIRKAFEVISDLGSVKRCTVTQPYLDLKLEELRLVHEYQEKLQAEKEEQRRIREQIREEEIALRELERASQEAEKEETRYAAALARAREEAERAVGARHEKLVGQIDELERRLAEAHANKERAVARAQLTRSGHVYVVSNVGSFGDDVYKIGMTRRLDPMDRVRELGDASVPFTFDVHAILFSEDAPSLEAALHRAFHDRRVNLVNERKEFFRVTVEEIAAVVREHHGQVELTMLAEAKEYRQTLAIAAERAPARARPASAGGDGP